MNKNIGKDNKFKQGISTPNPDQTCDCIPIHRLIFTCSLSIELCTWQKYQETKGQFVDYKPNKDFFDGFIKKADINNPNQNCLVLEGLYQDKEDA